MKPRQIGNFNTGTSGLLLAFAIIASPIAVIKACLSKQQK
jgi:hypothetical protein